MDEQEYVKCFPRWQFRAIRSFIECRQFRDSKIHLKSYHLETSQTNVKIIQRKYQSKKLIVINVVKPF